MQQQNLFSFSDFVGGITDNAKQFIDIAGGVSGAWKAVDQDSYNKYGGDVFKTIDKGMDFADKNDVFGKAQDYSAKADQIWNGGGFDFMLI